jgi:hypothetical protein
MLPGRTRHESMEHVRRSSQASGSVMESMSIGDSSFFICPSGESQTSYKL